MKVAQDRVHWCWTFGFCLLACLLACLLTYLLTYSLTHSLSPWCRILFEKLIVTQLVKKYLAFFTEAEGSLRVHKSTPLDCILSQPNPVRPIDPYLPKVYLNVILPPTPTSSQWSLAFGPPNQNPVNTSPLPPQNIIDNVLYYLTTLSQLYFLCIFECGGFLFE
jgi:hypothetical protein